MLIRKSKPFSKLKGRRHEHAGQHNQQSARHNLKPNQLYYVGEGRESPIAHPSTRQPIQPHLAV